MKKKLKVGLDFGTSNSAIATVENNKIRIFKTKEGQPTQPSSIFIRVDGYVSVGNQAIEDFQNPEQHTDEYHFIPSIKPGLPVDYYDGNVLRSKKTIVDGKLLTRFFPVEELGSSLISDLKKRAESFVGARIERVVLGRPVYFSEDEQFDKKAQDRLELAARKAGFREVRFVLEPVAAALYYEKYFATGESHKIFVFDFGGGTLDVSVLSFDGSRDTGEALTIDKLFQAVLGTHSIALGGTDFDKDVFNTMFLKYFGSNVTYDKKRLPMPVHFYHDITKWHLREHEGKNRIFEFLRDIVNNQNCSDREAVSRLVTLIEDQQVYSILRKIESAKIQLSVNGTGHIKHNHRNIRIDEPLNRKRFETIVRSRVVAVQKCVDDCLKKAQISPQEIDFVLKVGGSSNNLFVDKILREIFPGHIRVTDVFTSVVSGLAVAAENLFD